MIRDLIKKILFVFGTFILVSSCKFFSADLKGFLEYYSGSAGVGDVKYPETVGVASNGKVCIDSKTEKSFNLLLRNPQGYKNDGSGITIKYEFNNSELNENTWYPEINLNEDLITATMTFSKENLEQLEKGAVKDDDNNLIKDLSGICRIYSNFSSSYFEGDYPVNFMVNSAPERIRGAMFQITGKKNTQPNYVVAFNAPKIAGTVHEADTHHIYIGKNHWEFSGDYNLTPVSVESGCSLSKTKPSPLYDLDDNDSTFNSLASEGYVPLYFISNEIMDDSSRVVTYKLSIIDDYGLSTNTVISNVPYKLQPPKFSSLTGASTYPAEEESEEFKFVINHYGDTFYIDEEGTEQKGATCKNPVMIDYVVKQNGTVIKTGVKQAPVTISLPSAIGYTVEAYAYSDGVIDSVKNTSSQFGVSRSNIYYVSQNAEDGGTGSKAKPYKTIEQCFNTIYQQYNDFHQDDDPDEIKSYTINLLSDISAQGNATFFIPLGDGSDYNYIKNTIVTVQGYGGVRKIRNIEVTGEEREAYSAISVVDVPKMTLKLNNLEITSEYGAGIEANSSNAVDIELENVTVKDCNSNGVYAGLYFNTTGKLTLSNTVVTNNRSINSFVKGAGIFANQGEIHLKNKVVISNNYDSENHASNLYLRKDGSNQTKVFIDSPLSAESRIGVTTEQKAIVGTEVIFTQGYYTYNSRISPSSIFQSDDNFGVCWENPTANSGEASLVKSGSLMLSEFYKDIQIELNQDRTYTAGLKLVPTLKLVEIVDGEPVPTVVSSSKVKWDVTASVYGEDFTSLCTVQSDGTIIIPNSVVKDKYAIYIQVVYQGKYYSVTKYIDVRSLNYLTTTSSIPSGTELKVTTWDELAAISSIIGTGTNPNLEGVKIMLERDITIPSDTRWTPIGNFETPFKGTFDGNKKTISGLSIYSSSENGLFGVTQNAVIKNVTVEGSSTSSSNYTGGIVGRMKGGLIENCINKMSVSCSDYMYTGGIAGSVENNGVILNCVNKGPIIGRDSTGGIIGYVGQNCKIISCYNNADVTNSSPSTSKRGGIAGRNEGEVINCYAQGDIKVIIDTSKTNFSSETGGIVGYNTGVVKNCVAEVNLPFGTTNNWSYMTNNKVANVVGANAGTVENCYFILGSNTVINCGLNGPRTDRNGTSPSGKTDQVTATSSAATINTAHAVGNVSSKNPVELLNTYVDLNSKVYELKRWTYDTSAQKIIFAD